MNKLQNITLLLALIGILRGSNLQARGPEMDAKLRAAFGNVQAMTPKVLRDPANADLIAELRTIATRSNETLATVLIMRYGDDAAIQDCVNRLHSERRKLARRQLIMAGSPKAIAFLAAEFNREENAEGFFVGDQLRFGVSMNAASVVRDIIMENAVFSADVKTWASALPPYSPGVRQGIRAWWARNQASLLAEDYAAVVAPSL